MIWRNVIGQCYNHDTVGVSGTLVLYRCDCNWGMRYMIAFAVLGMGYVLVVRVLGYVQEGNRYRIHKLGYVFGYESIRVKEGNGTH